MRAFLGKDGLHNHNMSELAINIDEKEKRLTVATHGEDAPIDVHGAKATAFARFIHMGDPKSVEHSVLKLEKADQGGGVVKQLFKACVPLYDKLGMKHISVCANVDGGAYAWAKYGFEYFDANEKKQHAQQIKQAIFTHTKGKKLTEDSQEELAAIQKVLADKGNSKTVWHLSDLQTPALDEQFRSTIGRTFKKKGNFMKLLFLGGDVKGSRWAGKLSLDSKSPARARLSKYVGL
jgi:N-acetylglutamate synthase-like GNAT family acetyltransferase